MTDQKLIDEIIRIAKSRPETMAHIKKLSEVLKEEK